jgi:glutaminyl-peptide cyclotransferase
MVLYIATLKLLKMIKYNLFAFMTLVSFFMSCNDTKNNNKNLFSIDSEQFKLMYHNDETVNLFVKNENKKTIDSIVYFNNDKKIGSVKGNSKFNFILTNEKLGYQNLKAVVYFDGKNSETTTRIEMVSTIEPKLLTYTILNTYNHDTGSFTEGLEFNGNYLYESIGLRGKSKLLKTDHKTGKIIQTVTLKDNYFGEGLTIINNKIYQLTWQEKTGFIYDLNSMKLEKTFKYDKDIEGWGMTNDGKNIYESDGTEKIWKMNPENQKIVDFVNVYTNTSKIKSVNELEWVEGKIYGNIWQKDAIAVINPSTGAVEAVIDLSGLRKLISASPDDVLNGIAYNPKTKTVFVTGKNWNKLFEIKIN